MPWAVWRTEVVPSYYPGARVRGTWVSHRDGRPVVFSSQASAELAAADLERSIGKIGRRWRRFKAAPISDRTARARAPMIGGAA